MFTIALVFVALFNVACIDASTQLERDILASHNWKRHIHDAVKLTLNPFISRHAQNFADVLAKTDKFEHNSNKTYGENLYYVTNNATPKGINVTMGFYNEIKDYDYNNPVFSLKTGHFTQLVWKNTRQMGVGYAKSLTGKTYVVVNYHPKGNVQGQFEANVARPKTIN